MVVNLVVFTGVLLLWMAVTGHIDSAGDLSQSLLDLAIRKDTTAVPLAAAYVANAAGFVVSVLTNYYLNRRWTFRSTGGGLEGAAQVLHRQRAPPTSRNWSSSGPCTTWPTWPPSPASWSPSPRVMPINFVVNKLWSFRGA